MEQQGTTSFHFPRQKEIPKTLISKGFRGNLPIGVTGFEPATPTSLIVFLQGNVWGQKGIYVHQTPENKGFQVEVHQKFRNHRHAFSDAFGGTFGGTSCKKRHWGGICYWLGLNLSLCRFFPGKFLNIVQGQTYILGDLLVCQYVVL